MYRNPETECSGDEVPGRKKSRFKALKSRLFGRLKRKDTDGPMKESQSASDVTAPEPGRGGYDSEEDLLYPKGTLSSRALSYDSIFLADQAQSSSEPTRVLSQENVHGRIKTLQLKLQQQNLRMGPPPLLIPSKRQEDSGVTSEDDGLPHSPPEISFQDGGRHTSAYKFPDTQRNHSTLSLAGTGSEEEEQVSSQPPSRSLSPLSHSSIRPSSPIPTAPPAFSPTADFSSPAQFTSCLDMSAARHRMSVKPRNQRPSNKAKKLPISVYRPRSESMCDLGLALSEEEEAMLEGSIAAEEKTRIRSHSAQVVTTEREDVFVLELQRGRRHNMSPKPQEGHILMPDLEEPTPKSNSILVISKDKDPEQPEPKVPITSKSLFLQSMPEDLQSEPSDMTPPPAFQSSLSDPTKTVESLEQSVDTPCSRDEEHDKCQEEAEYLTEPHKQLETTKANLPRVTPRKLQSETLKRDEQSVNVAAEEYRPMQDAKSVPSAEKRKSVASDMSIQAYSRADLLTKYQPVAAPRVRKPVADPSYSASLKSRTESSVAESERETTAQPEVVLRARVTPTGLESQMSMNSEKCRPNSGSFNFFVSSARHRSKIVDSRECSITNPDEARKPVEPAVMTPLNNKDTTERHRDQPEDPTKELPQKHQFTPEKRTNLRREIVPNVVTRTMEEKTDGHVREAKTIECQRKTNAGEERRNAFGVTLRATSLSLKYRSETTQSESKNKRHSLETGQMGAILEDLPGQHMGTPQPAGDKGSSTMRTETTNKSFLLRKHSSMRADSGPTVTVHTGQSTEHLKSKDTAAMTRQKDGGSKSSLGSSEGLDTEPSWKRAAWERGRGQQQQPSSQPASEAPAAEAPPQVQLRPLQRTPTTLTPPKPGVKPSTPAPVSKPGPARAAPDRPVMSPWLINRTTAERCDGANKAEDKKPTLSRLNDGVPGGDQQTKYNFKPALGASGSSWSQLSSSSSLQQSARSQPSWMELAKRKSSAWNDKSMD